MKHTVLFAGVTIVFTLQAMNNEPSLSEFPKDLFAAAVAELDQKQSEIKKRIIFEADVQRDSVPDFFGLFRCECLLPQGLQCCENSLLREKYLDSIENKIIRYALAVNWAGKLLQQQHDNGRKISLLGMSLFIKKYQLMKRLYVDGKDLQSTFKLPAPYAH